jgi:alkylated DNA repair dioxygenase AlkB
MDIETIWLDTNSKLEYIQNFLSYEETNIYYHKLHDSLEWHAEQIKIYGKTYWQPRLLAWYGDNGISYRYSGIEHLAIPWTPELIILKDKIENLKGVTFNSVLANQYRNGRDSMGWHSDDEKELGENPLIASLSLGEERKISFRSKFDKEKLDLKLDSGSLLIMSGATQQNWQHAVPKTKKDIGIRINLTFRKIYQKL